MSASCRNNWSVLLTSQIGNCAMLRSKAANHIPCKASNVAQIAELRRGTMGSSEAEESNP